MTVWEGRCGKEGVGRKMWEEGCGNEGVIWEFKDGVGMRVWEGRYGNAGVGMRVWEGGGNLCYNMDTLYKC